MGEGITLAQVILVFLPFGFTEALPDSRAAFVVLLTLLRGDVDLAQVSFVSEKSAVSGRSPTPGTSRNFLLLISERGVLSIGSSCDESSSGVAPGAFIVFLRFLPLPRFPFKTMRWFN